MRLRSGTGSCRLLVSVRSLQEAQAALFGGADIIDVKEPHRGSLGRADQSVIDSIRDFVWQSDCELLTYALGELSELSMEQVDCSLIGEGGSGIQESQVSFTRARRVFAKVGFAWTANRDWRSAFHRFSERTVSSNATKTSLIPAAYADFERANAPSPGEILQLAIECKSPFVLIDTCCKDGRGLLHWFQPHSLAEWIDKARSNGIGAAVAGSLTLDDLRQFQRPWPNVIAVRGAICNSGDRNAIVDAARVGEWKTALNIFDSLS